MTMRVLIDLQHPAHLHFFRPVVQRLRDEGHEVLLTGRDKDILVELGEKYGLEITVFGVAKAGVLNLGRELFYRQSKLWKIISDFKPDVMMAIAGTFISSLGWLRRIPTYVFYDTEHATISNLLAYPFCRCVYVPDCYRGTISWKHERYTGYHELAYLHPKYFTPDESVLAELGLAKGERFAIVRFVAWGAAHDVGLAGFTDDNKHAAIEELSEHGRVFISCEGDLPEELESYRLKLPVHRMHDLLAFAALVFGESATMCSEGAVLGIPGVYVDPVGRGYTDEQEKKYDLVSNFTSKNQEAAIAEGVERLRDFDREHWAWVRGQLLNDTIDVTELLFDVATKQP